jgi:hypothetical protein
MADLKNVIVVGDGPIKDDAALHGRDIGYVWGGYGTQLTVDYAELHDAWVPIVNPPTWKDTGKRGWIKWSRVAEMEAEVTRILVSYYKDGHVTAEIVA